MSSIAARRVAQALDARAQLGTDVGQGIGRVVLGELQVGWGQAVRRRATRIRRVLVDGMADALAVASPLRPTDAREGVTWVRCRREGLQELNDASPLQLAFERDVGG